MDMDGACSPPAAGVNHAGYPSIGDGVTHIGAVDLTSPGLGGDLYNYSDMTGSTLYGPPQASTSASSGRVGRWSLSHLASPEAVRIVEAKAVVGRQQLEALDDRLREEYAIEGIAMMQRKRRDAESVIESHG